MYAALMGKLNARRKGLLEENEKGFTLIELLVVVIIIGILAAIAIPIYIGVQNNAKDSSVQNDVSNLKTAVIAQQTNSGAYPTAITTALDGTAATPSTFPSTAWTDAGATLGTNTKSLKYAASSTGTFCIIGISSTNKTFYATDSKGVSTTSCTLPTT